MSARAVLAGRETQVKGEYMIRMSLFWATISFSAILFSCGGTDNQSAVVPMKLDHNRMLVNAEMQRADGTWRTVLLWVDTGNPEFIMSPSLARDLGIDLSETEQPNGEPTVRALEVPPPDSIRIGNLLLDFSGVRSSVLFQPAWLFSTMHCDANLPSTVLNRYHVIFDYPRSECTLSPSTTIKPRGVRTEASIDTVTGIVQIDAMIDGKSFSFALDNGASYSFVSGNIARKLVDDHPQWPHATGAVGCANIWGWWPEEPSWPMVRLPEIDWGGVKLKEVALAGLPDFFGGRSLGECYSTKTARPVDGFLGPNALKAFRIEIDYVNGAVYFEQGSEFDTHDLDVVGLTLQPQPDSSYLIIGVADTNGPASAPGPQSGDILIQIDSFKTTGATMGAVTDALRGRSGDVKTLSLERDGRQLTAHVTVRRWL